jgi:hypothetical protein
MNWFLLSVFMGLAIAMILPGLRRKDYRMQLPCVAGLAALFEVGLPLASINAYPGDINPGELARFSVMAILCLGATWAGYYWWRPNPRMRFPYFNSRKLGISSVILVVFGGLAYWHLGGTTPDLDPVKGTWTGIATIYLFFTLVMRYGAILAAILFFRTKNWKLLLLALPQLFDYIRLFMIGRRAPTGEMFVVICLLLFFYRKWTAPLWIMALGTFAMALFSLNIETVRRTNEKSLSERIRAIKEADPLHSITSEGMAERHTAVDIRNGVRFMEAKAQGGHYTLGLHFWNSLVFSYVPAQILGHAFKDSLMIPLTDDTALLGFEKDNGTCESGIAEAFMAFGYLGFGLFFAMGAFIRRLWEGAIRGSIAHQLFLMLLILPAVLSFSVQLWNFLNTLVNMAIFVGPLLWWSRTSSRPVLAEAPHLQPQPAPSVSRFAFRRVKPVFMSRGAARRMWRLSRSQ